MQTPGRAVEPQTPMVPLERRMDAAYERLLTRAQEGAVTEKPQIRGLGRVILEMEQLNNNMKSIQSEIRRDIRARRKYFKEEQKLLKKDIQQQQGFQTAALFDLRKIIGLASFGIAANELAQGDIAGAAQGLGLGTAAFLPEIATGVISILAAKGLIGGGIGGGMMGGGMVAGGLGMLGGGKGKAILALASLGGLLLTGQALAGNADSRRVEAVQQTNTGDSLMNQGDVTRFGNQLSRFNVALVDLETTRQTGQKQSTIRSPEEEGQQDNELNSLLSDTKGTDAPSISQAQSTVIPTEEPETETVEPKTTIVPTEEPETETVEPKSTVIPTSLEQDIRDGNIMPGMMTDVPGDDIMTDDPYLKSGIQTIREAEGTDSVDTGYSQWFGDKAGDMKYGDITGKTLQEVHDLQTQFLKDKQSRFTDLSGNTNRSAAVGAGQFIHLKDDAERLLGVDANEQKFTPKFQNQLIEAKANESGVNLRKPLTQDDMGTLGKTWAGVSPHYNQTKTTAADSFDKYSSFLDTNLDSMLTDRQKKKLDSRKDKGFWGKLFGGGKKKNIEPVEGKSGSKEPVIINQGGNTQTLPPPLPPVPENITGSVDVSTVFDGSIDKLESAYSLNTYAAFG